MGSYKWSYESPMLGYSYGYPTDNPLITTHEPLSRHPNAASEQPNLCPIHP